MISIRKQRLKFQTSAASQSYEESSSLTLLIWMQEDDRATGHGNHVKAVRKDRSKTVVVGWTKFGLLEMTRKRK